MAKLNVENRDGLIARMIEQAPPEMMFRELFQNAIEAVTGSNFTGVGTPVPTIQINSIDPASVGYGPSYFTNFSYGPNKLSFWNNCKGMTAEQLREAVNIASSIDKSQGILKNFGIGAKATALGVNQVGMIWLSCKNGKVVTTLLCKDTLNGEDQYICHDFVDIIEDSNTGFTDVWDITEIASDPPFPWSINQDWTAIILCGNTSHQNTVEKPYESTKPFTKSWLINNLYNRYFRIPENIDARLFVGHNKTAPNGVKFVPIYEYVTSLAVTKPDVIKHEFVTDKDQSGIKIWYLYDGPCGVGGKGNEDRPVSTYNNNATNGSFSAIVYKDEMYDCSYSDKTWKSTAGKIGVLYDSRYFRVFVELDHTATISTTDDENNTTVKPEIIPDQYRQHLMRNNAEKTILKLEDYVSVIRNNMPDWFKVKIKDHMPPTTISNADILARGNELLSKLINQNTLNLNKNGTPTPIASISGGGNGNSGNSGSGNGGGGNGGTSNSSSANNGKPPVRKTTPGNKFRTSVSLPTIQNIRTEDELEKSSAEGLKNRAASVIEGQAIYINWMYEVVDETVELLSAEYQVKSTDIYEKCKVKAREIVCNQMTWLVVKGICQVLAKKSKASYDADDIKNGLHPTSLTSHADNIKWDNDFDECKKLLKDAVKEIESEQLLNSTDQLNANDNSQLVA